MIDDAQQPALRFSISPEPTPEEEGAIVATLSMLVATKPAVAPVMPRRPISAWALAGRETAHRSIPGAIPRWSRPRAWLTDRTPAAER